MKTLKDLAIAYDNASLAYDRNPTEANRKARREADVAYEKAQRTADIAASRTAHVVAS